MLAPHAQLKLVDSVAVFRKEERSYFVEDDWHLGMDLPIIWNMVHTRFELHNSMIKCSVPE